MKLMTQPGDTLTEGFGPDLAAPTLLVTMTREHNGIAFRTSDGVNVIAGLTKTFTDRDQAIAFYRHVRDAAMQGKRIHQIVWEIQALEAAQTAATAEETADAIRAEWDARHAQTVAAHNKLVADVQAIIGNGTGWNEARNRARQSTAAPASDAMERILTAARHNGGRIIRSRTATSTQLVALANRGLVELTYSTGRTRRITGAVLNTKGAKVVAA